MKAFADLLRIPLEPPDVNPTVRSATQEDGLVIEDVSWPTIDGEVVPAFIVRPAKSVGRLPPVVCLHGTSTNREVNIKPEFGYGEWTRYRTGQKVTTLFGWARELGRRGYVTLSLTQRGLVTREPDTEARNKALLVHGRNVMGAIVFIVPGGAPDYLYQCWRTGRFALISSEQPLDEFRRVTRHPRLQKYIRRPAAAGTMLNQIRALAELTSSVPSVSVCVDPADNFLLAMAEVSTADYLIIGDGRHLLTLEQYGSTRIITAREAAALLGM